jgi:Predicted membrane protein (DUF2079)
MFGILLAMEKRWWWLFGVLSAFILAVREDGGISLFGVGFYLIVSRRYPRLGLAVCTLSFAYMVLLTNAIMPLFSEDISRRFMIERFGQYADGEEASTVEIIWGIVSNPLRLVVELFSPFFGTIRYLISHWLPFAFVPAASPAAWAIAGFPLLKLFLGKGESVLAINIRYAMTVVPGMCYGAILWWKGRETLLDTPLREFVFKPFYLLRSLTVWRKIIDRVINWWEQHPKWLKLSMRRFWTICLCISLFFSFTSNPNRTLSFIIPDSIQPWVYVPLPRQWEHATAIRSLLKQIPPDASVSATTFIVPHLSGRREIIRFPSLKFRNDRRQVVKVDYAIADIWQFRGDRQTLQDSLSTIKWVTSDREYGMIDLKDGVVLLKKGATSKPEALSQWKSIVNSQ